MTTPEFGYWNSHQNWWPITCTWKESLGAGAWVRKIVWMVGTRMVSSTIAGTVVQVTSTRVLPWICGGKPSVGLRR